MEEAHMSLSYCNQKLSLAVFEMCVSTQGLRNRLRGSIKHGFTEFPETTFPEGLREQLSEIKVALAGVRVGASIEDYPDPIDAMKPAQVRRLLDQIISLREGVAQECYRRRFQERQSGSEDHTLTMDEMAQKPAQLLGREPGSRIR
jgi:hypothetical protein